MESFIEIARAANADEFSLRKASDRYLLENISEPDTLRAKRNDFNQLCNFLNEPTLAALTKANLERFRDFKAEQGEAYSTINRRLSTIRDFARKFYERCGRPNELAEVKDFELPLPDSQALTPEEIDRLRSVCGFGTTAFKRARNRLQISFLIETGLRSEETRSLKLGQLEKRWLRSALTKGRKVRSVYLAESLDPILTEYLEQRKLEMNRRYRGHLYLSKQEQGQYPLFVSFYNADINDPESFQMSSKAFWDVVVQAGKLAGIENLYPHRFRHTFARHLLESGNDIMIVKRALGHSDIRTTMRYTEASDDTLAAAVEGSSRKR